jgi:hypothetical protein
MAEGPVPVIQPGPPPPRPDRPQVSRSPLFPVFLVAFALAIVFTWFAFRALLQEPVRSAGPPPEPRPITSPASVSPSPTVAPHPRTEGAFRFFSRAVGGGPVRWDPCEPITYAINPSGASIDVRPDVREAIRRVSDATGIRFRPTGTTREGFLHAFLRMRFRGVFGGAEVILFWVDHSEYVSIIQRIGVLRPSIALGKPFAGLYQHRDQYFGGLILIDADAVSVPGFAFPRAHGLVLLHELGHVMGLGHVKDRDQLMYSGRQPNTRLHGYGDGDREGLRHLGVDAGCLD